MPLPRSSWRRRISLTRASQADIDSLEAQRQELVLNKSTKARTDLLGRFKVMKGCRDHSSCSPRAPLARSSSQRQGWTVIKPTMATMQRSCTTVPTNMRELATPPPITASHSGKTMRLEERAMGTHSASEAHTNSEDIG